MREKLVALATACRTEHNSITRDRMREVTYWCDEDESLECEGKRDGVM